MTQTAVGTSAVRLDTDPPRPSYAAFRNAGAASVFLGGSSAVTDLNGFELTAGSTLTIDLPSSLAGQVWAISATGSNVVHRLQIARGQ